MHLAAYIRFAQDVKDPQIFQVPGMPVSIFPANSPTIGLRMKLMIATTYPCPFIAE
jgi:hypothetical protein